jgi:hypothetical protein
MHSFGWLVTTAIALYCVRTGNLIQHRRWMIGAILSQWCLPQPAPRECSCRLRALVPQAVRRYSGYAAHLQHFCPVFFSTAHQFSGGMGRERIRQSDNCPFQRISWAAFLANISFKGEGKRYACLVFDATPRDLSAAVCRRCGRSRWHLEARLVASNCRERNTS